jgi:hypothetical protein
MLVVSSTSKIDCHDITEIFMELRYFLIFVPTPLGFGGNTFFVPALCV